jgi:ABC-type sugar transport system ATPase subunit
MSLLRLEAVAKRYRDVTVLHEVSLEVADGELLVLVGPSGCGKSTLLRIIAGLVPASAGAIWIDDRRVDALTPRERDVAMVFQSYALYPHMTVRANLSFPLRLRRLTRAEVERRVGEAAEILGLQELLERKPSELSGGQMQRVALGRAIVRRPRLFLFDEPLSNLDAKLRGRMRGEIARLHRELGITTIYVTHDQAEAMTLGSRIAVLEGGRLLQLGPPLEVFQRPATDFVATFIGSPPMNVLAGEVRAGVFSAGGFRVPLAGVDPGPARVGLRPHDVALCPGDATAPQGSGRVGLPARISFVEALGTQTVVECELEGTRLVASAEGPQPWREGQHVLLVIPLGALHAFDAASGRRLEREVR